MSNIRRRFNTRQIRTLLSDVILPLVGVLLVLFLAFVAGLVLYICVYDLEHPSHQGYDYGTDVRYLSRFVLKMR